MGDAQDCYPSGPDVTEAVKILLAATGMDADNVRWMTIDADGSLHFEYYPRNERGEKYIDIDGDLATETKTVVVTWDKAAI